MRCASRALRPLFGLALLSLSFTGCASSKKDDGTGDRDGGARDRGAARDKYIEEDWLWPDTAVPDGSEPQSDQRPPDDQGPTADRSAPADKSTPTADKSPPTADKSTPAPDTTPKPDAQPVDAATPADAAGAVTCGKTGVWIEEVATGQPDYVSIKNAGAAAISVVGYKVEMYGISPTVPATYTIKATDVGGDLSPNAVLYLFEYSSGTDPGDVDTGTNIPFYDGDVASSQKPNAVLLYDASGKLVDYFAVGATVALPNNVSFTAVAWPATFDSDASSFQRAAHTGSCPSFKTSDWGVSPITRR